MIAIIAFGLMTVAVDAGLGRHVVTLNKEHVSRALEFETLAQFFALSSIMFTRLSICLSLLRFAALQGWFSTTIYCTMGVIVMTNLSSDIVILMFCRPVQKAWTPNLPGTCWSHETQHSLGLYNGGE